MVEDGQILPELEIEITPTFVVAYAIGTRDFQDVHHDRDKAVARGSQDIFINILTTTGLVQRYVTDWAGPEAIVRQIAIRLGVPCYAGDTLTFSGRVARGAAGVSSRGGVASGPGGGVASSPGDGGEASPGGGGEASPGGGGEAKEWVVEVVGRCRLGDHVTGTVRLGPAGSAP
jgi:hypothetical protein